MSYQRKKKQQQPKMSHKNCLLLPGDVENLPRISEADSSSGETKLFSVCSSTPAQILSCRLLKNDVLSILSSLRSACSLKSLSVKNKS